MWHRRRGRRNPRKGVMLIMSTLVITFVGATGLLGIHALALSVAVSTKMTGVASSAAFAGASAVDLTETAKNGEGAVILNVAQAQQLATDTFEQGKASNNMVNISDVAINSIDVYNIATSEKNAKGENPTVTPGDPNCTMTTPVTYCWLAVSYRTAPRAAEPNLALKPKISRQCLAPNSTTLYNTCSMHFTTGVAVTIRYRVSPCSNVSKIPFCSAYDAYASGYSDYTYRDT